MLKSNSLLICPVVCLFQACGFSWVAPAVFVVVCLLFCILPPLSLCVMQSSSLMASVFLVRISSNTARVSWFLSWHPLLLKMLVGFWDGEFLCSPRMRQLLLLHYPHHLRYQLFTWWASLIPTLLGLSLYLSPSPSAFCWLDLFIAFPSMYFL